MTENRRLKGVNWMGVNRFEDIEAWKKARELVKVIYQVTGLGDFARDFSLRDQIRRASVSIMSNIAEGFGRDGDKEFRRFLFMASGSVSEVKSQLYIAFDVCLIDKEQFDNLYKLADETGRLVGGFIRYLESSTYQSAVRSQV
jgi:four helix bundle protein